MKGLPKYCLFACLISFYNFGSTYSADPEPQDPTQEPPQETSTCHKGGNFCKNFSQETFSDLVKEIDDKVSSQNPIALTKQEGDHEEYTDGVLGVIKINKKNILKRINCNIREDGKVFVFYSSAGEEEKKPLFLELSADKRIIKSVYNADTMTPYASHILINKEAPVPYEISVAALVGKPIIYEAKLNPDGTVTLQHDTVFEQMKILKESIQQIDDKVSGFLSTEDNLSNVLKETAITTINSQLQINNENLIEAISEDSKKNADCIIKSNKNAIIRARDEMILKNVNSTDKILTATVKIMEKNNELTDKVLEATKGITEQNNDLTDKVLATTERMGEKNSELTNKIICRVKKLEKAAICQNVNSTKKILSAISEKKIENIDDSILVKVDYLNSVEMLLTGDNRTNSFSTPLSGFLSIKLINEKLGYYSEKINLSEFKGKIALLREHIRKLIDFVADSPVETIQQSYHWLIKLFGPKIPVYQKEVVWNVERYAEEAEFSKEDPGLYSFLKTLLRNISLFDTSYIERDLPQASIFHKKIVDLFDGKIDGEEVFDTYSFSGLTNYIDILGATSKTISKTLKKSICGIVNSKLKSVQEKLLSKMTMIEQKNHDTQKQLEKLTELIKQQSDTILLNKFFAITILKSLGFDFSKPEISCKIPMIMKELQKLLAADIPCFCE